MTDLKFEKITIERMTKLYCLKNYHSKTLCHKCQSFLVYAFSRLDNCPFKTDKPTCAQCPIHCYNKSEREKAIEIMRFAGPRMLFRHPFLALRHLWLSRLKPSTLRLKAK